MDRRFWIIISLAIFSCAMFGTIAVEENNSGVDVAWTSEKLDSAFVGDNGEYILLFGKNTRFDETFGFPAIPREDLSIVLPANGSFDLVIESARWEFIGNARLAPIPRFKNFGNEEYREVFKEDSSAYSQNRWFPMEPVSLEDAGFVRNVRLGRISIYSIRYNPLTNAIERLVDVSFRVDFSGSIDTREKKLDRIENEIIAKSINPKSGAKLTLHRARRRPQTGIMSQSQRWFTFPVSSSGLMKIDRNFLNAIGVNTSGLDPDAIRLFDDGWRELSIQLSTELPDLKEVPLYAVGLSDGSFDSGDALYFYARGPNDWFVSGSAISYHTNRFTNNNYYWLSIGGTFGSPARRLQTESPPSANEIEKGTLLYHVEYDQIFAKTDSDIIWGWERTSSKNSSFLDSRLIVEDTVIVRYRLVPVQDEGLPTTSLLVNGRPPGWFYTLWSGYYEGRFSGVFTDNINSLEMRFYGITPLFDYYEIQYNIRLEKQGNSLSFKGSDSARTYIFSGFTSQPMVFDITNQTDLRMLAVSDAGMSRFSFSDSLGNRRYFISTLENVPTPTGTTRRNLANLRDRDFSCDLLMIIPDGLQNSLGEYIAYRESSGKSVEWVLVEDVILEFGYGTHDPTAIRDFLRFIWLNASTPPEYVMLVGDATWDPRGITNPQPTYCPSALCVQNASDDYFYSVTFGDFSPDYAGGRVPINTINEWRYFVEKLKRTEGSPEYGPWRIRYVFSADDERKSGNIPDTYMHTSQTSQYASALPNWADNRMVYLVDYPLTSAGLKPTAQAELIKQWNEGCVLVNYIGHGNFRLWSHEELFEATSCMGKLKNNWKLPTVFSASCEVGLFYRTTGQCIAEQTLLLPEAGSVASIAATRMTLAYSNGPLNNRFIQNCWGGRNRTTSGKALLAAKLGSSYSSTEGQYVLFGDPTMLVGKPSLDVSLSLDSDSLIAGKRTRVFGTVVQDSVVCSDFDGTAHVLVYDSGFDKTYSSSIIGGEVTYRKPGRRLFIGPVDVVDGRFEANFIVPIDISYGTFDGKVVVYANSGDLEGVGFSSGLAVVGDTTIEITDSIGPSIQLSFDGVGFSDGGIICGGGRLICTLSDESGINISGGTGHGITLTIDGDEANSKDISGNFSYNRNSFTSGIAIYDLYGLSLGKHIAKVKAWDNIGNSGFATLEFEVSDCRLAISNPLAYPNPFTSWTDITFNIGASAEIDIKIYTLSGRLVRQINGEALPAMGVIRWDGRDRNGNEVANGAYIAKISAVTGDGRKADSIIKIAKLK